MAISKRWLVRVWMFSPQGVPQVFDNISHHYDSDYRTARFTDCGQFSGNPKITEQRAKELRGKKPDRCRNCERVLAARRRHKKKGG